MGTWTRAGPSQRTGARRASLWLGLAVIGLTAGVVSGFAARQHTYTVSELRAHWRTPYDLVVFPKGSAPSTEGLVDPNSLDTGVTGITMREYRKIEHLPGVALAAPLAPLGYVGVNLGYINIMPTTTPAGLYRLTQQFLNQGLPNGLRLVTYWQRGANEVGLGAEVSLMAVNPVAESRLMGLGHAVVAGSYFSAASEKPGTMTSPTGTLFHSVPVLLTTTAPQAGRTVASVERLAVPASLQSRVPYLIQHAPFQFTPFVGEGGPLTSLSGPVVARVSVSNGDLWNAFIRKLRHEPVSRVDGYVVHGLGLQMAVSHEPLGRSGPLVLRSTRSPYPSRWPTALQAVPNRAMVKDWGLYGEPFRPAREAGNVNVLLDPIGFYNPVKLRVADDPLTHLPLVGYRPEEGSTVLSPSGRALNPAIAVRADDSPAGLWTAPPQALTPLPAVLPLLGPAPISSIRIRVQGVRRLGAGGQTRLEQVAREITHATGLPVAVVRGSSPEQILIHPGHLPGFQREGWLQTEWIRVGTSVEILRQVSLSQGVMLGPILVAAIVFAGISAWLGLAADRRRWGVALAVGVSPRTVWRQLIRQAGFQGLAVALLAVLTAGAVGGAAAFRLGLPVALMAAVLVVMAMTPAARMVARQDPVRGLKSSPPAGVARLSIGTGARLGIALAIASWRRLLLAAGALVVPAAVMYGVGLVEVAWHNTLHVTLLGQYLLVHGGWLMSLAALVTAGLTAVAAGEIASAGVGWRRGTWAVGSALGWSRQVPATAMAWESGLVGLLAGVLGTGVAVTFLSPLFGVPMVPGLAAGTVVGVILVSELAALPAVGAIRRLDPVVVLNSGQL